MFQFGCVSVSSSKKFCTLDCLNDYQSRHSRIFLVLMTSVSNWIYSSVLIWPKKKGIKPTYINSFKTNLFIRQWSTRILIKPQHWLLLLSLAIETQTFSVSVLVSLLRLRNTQSPWFLTEGHWEPSRTTETHPNPM